MKHFLFFLLFTGYCLHSQTQIMLHDKATNNPVTYANIWKEKVLYKTSDSLGVFDVDTKDLGHIFKITCVGYKDTIVKMSRK